MKYGFLFTFLGGLCGFYAARSPWLGWLLAWAGLSFTLVGLGYLSFGARVYGKRRDGTMAGVSRLALLPYLLFLTVIWRMARLVQREPPYHDLCDGVSIGRRLLAAEFPVKFTSVIDLTCEFPEPGRIREMEGYRCFPILDASAPADADLRDLLAELAEIEGALYIHCAEGHGRTGLVAASLLLERGLATGVEEAIRMVQERRPKVRLNREQTDALERFFASRVGQSERT
ncbi:MAG: tyrosine-protein phosphatase [Planctomycetota bacterium]|nr:tyrosine-protein phosphatase [Planctomycetota bacterium]